jgi:hypothetical protein
MLHDRTPFLLKTLALASWKRRTSIYPFIAPLPLHFGASLYPVLLLVFTVKNQRAQHDGALRAFVGAFSTADAASFIHSSCAFYCNGPDRTDIIAHVTAKAPL